MESTETQRHRDTETQTARIAALEAENAALRDFARALLARLSYDYGDGEDCPAEVEKLFEIGEELLPIEKGA